MKLFFSFLMLVSLQQISLAQGKYMVKSDQLLNRIQNGGDTVYIINFWATWCGPCVKELPNFEKLQESYKTEKLKVILVSVDFRSQLDKRLIPFLEKRKFKTEVYFLDEKDQQAYIEKVDKSWSGAIPASLFVKATNRKFFEKEFNYTILSNEYLKFRML